MEWQRPDVWHDDEIELAFVGAWDGNPAGGDNHQYTVNPDGRITDFGDPANLEDVVAPTPGPAGTQTSTPTRTPTRTPTSTPTLTLTPTPSRTSTPTWTASPTDTATPTATVTRTATPIVRLRYLPLMLRQQTCEAGQSGRQLAPPDRHGRRPARAILYRPEDNRMRL